MLDKLYTELTFRPHRSRGMHFSTSGDILFDQHARPGFQMLYTSALSRRKKFSFRCPYNQNQESIQDHFFFLTKHCLKSIIISKNIIFFYIPTTAEKVKVSTCLQLSSIQSTFTYCSFEPQSNFGILSPLPQRRKPKLKESSLPKLT